MPLHSSQTLGVILQHHQIPSAMIKIVNDQQITCDDLKEMTRDDVDHLFKNALGFTFRDRKLFWTTIEKIRSSVINNDDMVLMDPDEDLPNQYTPIDDDIQIKDVIFFHSPIVKAKRRRANQGDVQKTSNKHRHSRCDTSSRDEVESDDDPSRSPIATQPLAPPNFYFKYPVELPIFSDPIQRALQSKCVDRQWRSLIDECTRWILTKKTSYIEQRETQAIGHTLFDKYPSIAKSGFRPWSFFCRCLATSLRLERRRRALLST